MDFNDFTRVDLLDDNNQCANVYVEDKLVGKIYDSDIDRVQDKRRNCCS